MAHLRARKARLPDLVEDLAERTGLFAWNNVIARFTSHDLVTAESGRALELASEAAADDPGRPSRLTPAVADAIVEAVRSGASVKSAAETVGVLRRTVYDWLERGRREAHGAFLARLEAALDEARQPSWQEALAVLDAEFEGWEPPPLRDVLHEAEEGFQ